MQGCQLWDVPPDLQPLDLSKEQSALVGKVRRAGVMTDHAHGLLA